MTDEAIAPKGLEHSMPDQTAIPPPLPPGIKKRTRFKKTRIVLFTLAILWISYRLLSQLDLSALDSPDLKIKASMGVITITNAWDKPVTITGMLINNREDCPVNNLSNLTKDPSPTFPRTLRVGDDYIVSSSKCINIVRVEIQTDKGSDTFTLN